MIFPIEEATYRELSILDEICRWIDESLDPFRGVIDLTVHRGLRLSCE